jgi:hypothetical protein
MDPAVRILAEAMLEAVDGEDDRKGELGKTLEGEFNEFDLRPHFDDMSPNEKAACSNKAENLAEAHVKAHPISERDTRPLIYDAPTGTGMNWSEGSRKL